MSLSVLLRPVLLLVSLFLCVGVCCRCLVQLFVCLFVCFGAVCDCLRLLSMMVCAADVVCLSCWLLIILMFVDGRVCVLLMFSAFVCL